MTTGPNGLVIDKAIELFGFMMGQEIASNSLTPVDTGFMRSTFANTVQIIEDGDRTIVRFTTPFYTKFLEEGTERIKARHFIMKIFHQKGEEILRKAFRIASTQQ